MRPKNYNFLFIGMEYNCSLGAKVEFPSSDQQKGLESKRFTKRMVLNKVVTIYPEGEKLPGRIGGII